ncbi:hypothetical protein IWZ00DRAFT_513587 [Phyllosticta capitalensis]
MAFQQPRRPPVARPLSYTSPPPQEQAEPSQQTSPHRKRSLDESEEWVLFSPSVAGSAGRTHTTSTERTPRTAGLSRLSDFGSLDTAARSEQLDDDDLDADDADDNVTCQGTDPSDDAEAELDSLDDGLHAFHEPAQQLGDSSQTVFPTHDGFGTFPGSSTAVQEQMMQFEKYNNSRRPKQARRRSSVQRRLDVLEETEGYEQDERRQRIERWRLEQSRALLEEIERETRRRRRMSRASMAKSVAAASTAGESSRAASTATSRQDPAEDASFWRRFTKKVIRDLMGIDENLLSVIFGESLPAEAAASGSSSSAEAQDVTASSEVRDAPEMALARHETWEHRLLDRIARELGILVSQLSDHPGAFSTYLRTQEPLAYAGMAAQTGHQTARRSSNVSTAVESTATSNQSQSTPNIQFQPTLPPQTTTYSEASLWGIEEEPEPPYAAYHSTSAAAATAVQRDREYWERDLDVKMVFNFLKDRFSSRPPSPVNDGGASSDNEDGAAAGPVHPLGGRSHSRRPSSSAASPIYRRDSFFRDHHLHHHRAALIRHHHPLVSRNLHHRTLSSSNNNNNINNANTSSTTVTVPVVPVAPTEPTTPSVPAPMSRKNLRRFDNAVAGAAGGRRSSCASQSTRRSRKSGSSRNYWDLGGSGVGSAGPAGGGVVAGVTMGEV